MVISSGVGASSSAGERPLAPASTRLLCAAPGPANQTPAGLCCACKIPSPSAQGWTSAAVASSQQHSARLGRLGPNSRGHGRPPRRPAHTGRGAGGGRVPGARAASPPAAPPVASCRRLPGQDRRPSRRVRLKSAAACYLPTRTGRRCHTISGGHSASGEAVGQAAGRERRRREPRGRHGAAGRRGAGGEWGGRGAHPAR